MPKKAIRIGGYAWAWLLWGWLLSTSSAHAQRGNLPALITQSSVFDDHFVGFVLADAQTGAPVYSYNGDKYFTPGSNAKIFTLYTCMRLFGEKLPLLRYNLTADSLIFYGTGNPAWLHPYLPPDTSAMQFLRKRPENLYIATDNFQDDRYAAGWMWEDYEFYDQPERASLPLYSNVVTATVAPFTQVPTLSPSYFSNRLQYDAASKNLKPDITRPLNSNTFLYNGKPAGQGGFDEDIPFIYSDTLLAALLQDTLHKPVTWISQGAKNHPETCTLFGDAPADTLYRRMMQISDNFLAEQLLLLCSNELYGYQHTATIIAYAKQYLLSDLPDEPRWVEGSGLSRYNLFTPRSIIKVLHKLYTDFPQARLFDIFPAGGVNGTIKDFYKGSNGKPYVFAKTGTLSNNHSLSGYLRARSGKVYLFSFMHNNYVTKVGVIRREMEKVLSYIYENY